MVLPLASDSLFLASATTPVEAVERVLVALVGAALEEAAVLEDVELVAVRGDAAAAVPAAARLAVLAADGAVAVPVLRSVVLPGEEELSEEPETVEVRRALDVRVRLWLSSSEAEMEARDRWVAVDETLAAAVRRTVDDTGGRVGGLLSPPVARAAEDAVVLVAAEAVTGRRAVVGFVAEPDVAVLVLLTPLAADGGEEGT